MAGETILVIDAGQDMNQRITPTLQAESYMIYTASSQDVNVEMAEFLKPSLIYVKPVEMSPAGLEPCKAIRGIPLLEKIPIVLLTSLEGGVDPGYLKDYGIVDILEPTFSPEELIEKTGTILGKASLSVPPKKSEPAASPRIARQTEKKRPVFLLPAIGIGILVVISGAGFLAYRQLTPVPEVSPSPVVTPSVRVRPPVPEAGLKSQASPPRNAAEASPPASSAPSTPPEQPTSLSPEPGSQPPRKPFYSVQLGAFKNEDSAEALAKKFREKGYDAFTQPGVTRDKSPIYRVLISKHEDRKAAKKLAAEIQSREQVETTLYSE